MQKADRSSQYEHDEDRSSPFPVVSVVASAGDVAAFTRLLQHVPSNSGTAFVFIPAHSPEPAGALASVLARSTVMPVTEIAQKTTIEPNHVYVIPLNKLTRITGSVLIRAPRREQRGTLRPIDY